MKSKWIYNLPKIELHCHLDGSLSGETITKLAKMSNVVIPETIEELNQLLQVTNQCKSLAEYLEKFKLPIACLQTEDALEYGAYSLIKDVAKENVIYIEVRFAPQSCREKGLTAKKAVKSVIAGLKRGYDAFGVRSAVLVCGMRHELVANNIAMLEDVKEFLGKGVCGVDLAGSEADFPPMLQQEFFVEAKKLGFPITIHAGECQRAENVWDAILLGAKRVGHGIAIMNHPGILQEVKEKKIVLELCPSSNLQTKAVEDIKQYPIRKFMEKELCITLNTDNRMVTGTTLSQEYEKMASYFELTNEMLIRITKDAINAAFLDMGTKEELLAIVEDYPLQ
ncbi:MAG: adenosine deaminase [Velocimicrobium sp.]